MNRMSMSFMFIVFFSIALIAGLPKSAYAQFSCTGEIVKLATPEDDTPFNFSISGDINEMFQLSDPSDTAQGLFLQTGASITVTELPTAGWMLEDIDCVTDGPVTFSVSGNSVTIDCLDATGLIQCEFTNVPGLRAVPAITELGLLFTALILGIAGFLFVRRNKLSV